MKKIKSLLSILLCSTIMFFGCNSDSGSSSSGVNYDVPGAVVLPNITANQIIRNKVVNLNGSSSVYYEYLTFESETGGEYSVYEEKNLNM